MSLKVRLLLLGVAILVVSSMAIAGCDSGVSQEDYDAVVAERDAAEAEAADLESQIADLEDDLEACEATVEDLQAQLAVLPENITALLSVADEMDTLVTTASTEAFAAMNAAVVEANNAQLTAEWDKVTATLPDFTAARAQMLTMVVWILDSVTPYSDSFDASVQPQLSVADEMYTLVTTASTEAFAAMNAAVAAANDAQITAEWDKVTATLPDFTAARAQMLIMVVWMLADIAEAAPGSVQ
ncbi:MAG: hypothetical protein JSV02_04745 [Dehalococcoidia bacterium]|nr:MAG: hypothetical protein JSV02_04745 [Dehalococcoidia bacterium]